MAKKFLVALDLQKNELQNFVVQNLATAPANPKVGQMYFDTATQKLMTYVLVDGTVEPKLYAWKAAGGKIEASDIPDLASSKITAMTGYSKAESSAAIATTDSLNTAIGKLEYKADNAVVANSAIEGATKCKITYDSKGLVTAGADLAATDIPSLDSSKITTLTSYTKASTSAAIAITDSLNEALGKLEKKVDDAAAAIVGGLVYAGTFDLNPSGTAVTDYSALNASADIKKGYMYYVKNTTSASTPVTILGVEWKQGDYLLVNKDIAKSATITAADVEKIDNTEAEDIVRKDATQTLTHKTIDCATEGTGAGNNVITNLPLSALVSGTVVTTVSSTSTDSELPTAKAVWTEVDKRAEQKSTMPTADASAYTAGKIVQYTGADQSSPVVLKQGHFYKVTRSGEEGSYTYAWTEVEVQTPVDISGKQDKPTSATANNIAVFDANKNTIDSEKSFVTTVGAASGEGAATDAQVATALAVRTAINNAISGTKITATNPALAEATAGAGVCTWTISNTLATADVLVSIYEVSSGDECVADVSVSAASVTIKINAASVAVGTYKAVIMG